MVPGEGKQVEEYYLMVSTNPPSDFYRGFSEPRSTALGDIIIATKFQSAVVETAWGSNLNHTAT